ncbi:MAG: gamma carbonic anhydrase family protein [Frankiaceae bacterium]
MAIYAIGNRVPQIDPSAFVHSDATVIGDAILGPEAAVWPQAVLRADYGSIHIGARTSVQDGCVIHATAAHPTIIGSGCVLGHCAHLEGCTVEDGALIGSGSVVLHRALVGRHALVGAQALVPNDKVVPARAMALGVPVTIRTDAVAEGHTAKAVAKYAANARWYRAELRRLN